MIVKDKLYLGKSEQAENPTIIRNLGGYKVKVNLGMGTKIKVTKVGKK